MKAGWVESFFFWLLYPLLVGDTHMKNISHPGQRKIIAQPCSGIILLPKTSIFRSFLGLWGGNPLRKTIMWGNSLERLVVMICSECFFPLGNNHIWPWAKENHRLKKCRLGWDMLPKRVVGYVVVSNSLWADSLQFDYPKDPDMS